MNFDFSYLNLIVFASWLLTVCPVGIASVLIAGAVLFSKSISVSLMLYLTLTMISFVVVSYGGMKSRMGIAQKYYFIRLLGSFMAIFGFALNHIPGAVLLVFVGLLLALPTSLWSVLFRRHYEALSFRAYLYSVVLPAMVALNILFKLKGEMKTDYAQLWDVVLTVIGLGTFLLSSFYSYVQRSTKSALVHLTQSYVGLGLFLLVMESQPVTEFALSSLLAFAVTGPMLYLYGKQSGKKVKAVGQSIMIGLPGFLGFSTYDYSLRSIAGGQVNWVWAVMAAYVFQVLALMMNDRRLYPEAPKAKLRFWLVSSVQLACAVGFFVLEWMGNK